MFSQDLKLGKFMENDNYGTKLLEIFRSVLEVF